MSKKMEAPVKVGEKYYIVSEVLKAEKDWSIWKATVVGLEVQLSRNGGIYWKASLDYPDQGYGRRPGTMTEENAHLFCLTKKQAMINAYKHRIEDLQDKIAKKKTSCDNFVVSKTVQIETFKESLNNISGKESKKVAKKTGKKIDKEVPGRFRHLDVS